MPRAIYPLKLSAVEKSAIKARAEARGLTMAEYFRGLALGTIEPDPPLGAPRSLRGGSQEIHEPGGSQPTDIVEVQRRARANDPMARRRREIEQRQTSAA